MPVADSARDSIFTSEYSITPHITGHNLMHTYIDGLDPSCRTIHKQGNVKADSLILLEPRCP
jgi:hypothetical protein